ncbi:MAG: response regulator transcription factor [Chitinophagaceae bacterium]
MDGIKKILIADDHSIVSRGLHYLITLNFTGCNITQVPSLSALQATLSTDDFTHLILDLNLDDGNSIELIPQIIEKYPNLYILIYSMASEEIFGKKLLQYNISGFLSKKSEEAEIVRALRVFLQGGIFVSKKLKKSFDTKADDTYNEKNIFHSLSITELKVLGSILKGHRTKEIASEMNVTQQTIATFKSRIFKKLGTENIFEIQRLAEVNKVDFS